MTGPWGEVRRLATRHMSTPFPDCRGEDIDGVDLVMADADLYGCVSTLVSSTGRSPEHVRVLRDVVADLDRVLPEMPSEWATYFTQVRELGVATLAAVDRL